MSNIKVLYDNDVRADKIPIGTYFVGTLGWESTYTGLFLRTPDNIVCVTDPNSTWSWDDTAFAPFVANYKPVDVEIKVKKWKDN